MVTDMVSITNLGMPHECDRYSLEAQVPCTSGK
jgi:hypothetical protein